MFLVGMQIHSKYTTYTTQIDAWFARKGWSMFAFQRDCMQAVLSGKSGLLNAPTGSGKTLAMWLPFAVKALYENGKLMTNPFSSEVAAGDGHSTASNQDASARYSSNSANNASARHRGEAKATDDASARHRGEAKATENASAVVETPAKKKTPARRKKTGIRVLWITPLRALARDTEMALQHSAESLGVTWKVARRTGDSSAADKARIRKSPPEVFITTPESLHLLLSQSDHPERFAQLDAIVVDEWHELMGTKRGVQTELAIAYLREMRPKLQLWGISATIGNMAESMTALGLPPKAITIKADIEKNIAVHTLLPEQIDHFPWAGHIGLKLSAKVVDIVRNSSSTLLFTNTRSMTEIWYQHLLDAAPDLAGNMAIHHSSLNQELRNWVEESLHGGRLKLVICTSSLDLGVDFAPVETVIQVGSPKGVARFMQRAGRSGHQPGATSTIYFLPTHALEILDSVALQRAMEKKELEERTPLRKPLDVLVQFICTLAVGTGCNPEKLYNLLTKTGTYRELTIDEWQWVVNFLITGGQVLQHYEDYTRVQQADDGTLHIVNRRVAMRHRLSIGTILSDASLRVRFLKGGSIGTVEESFIARLKPGDVFLFAGRYLEYIRLKDLTVYVKKTAATKGAVSRWMGGRMQLSSQLAHHIRVVLQQLSDHDHTGSEPEIQAILPLLHKQAERSHLPTDNELLVEQIRTREGWHHFVYPLEGRAVHEGLASLLAWRIGRIMPISFSIAMNDYGFELLSDQPVPPELFQDVSLFSDEFLEDDLRAGINAAEMAKRQFREIARVSGLIFQGFPGKQLQNRHLQANSGLLFDVFERYETDNLLIGQSYSEVLHYQIELNRIARTLQRVQRGKIIFTQPDRFTPFSFPIMVDRLRSSMSSEKLEDRIRKMYTKLTK